MLSSYEADNMDMMDTLFFYYNGKEKIRGSVSPNIFSRYSRNLKIHPVILSAERGFHRWIAFTAASYPAPKTGVVMLSILSRPVFFL